MAVQTRVKPIKNDALKTEKHGGLGRDTLIRLYRTMYLSRKLDDRELHFDLMCERASALFFMVIVHYQRGVDDAWDPSEQRQENAQEKTG